VGLLRGGVSNHEGYQIMKTLLIVIIGNAWIGGMSLLANINHMLQPTLLPPFPGGLFLPIISACAVIFMTAILWRNLTEIRKWTLL